MGDKQSETQTSSTPVYALQVGNHIFQVFLLLPSGSERPLVAKEIEQLLNQMKQEGLYMGGVVGLGIGAVATMILKK